jgi:hypothetical protein
MDDLVKFKQVIFNKQKTQDKTDYQITEGQEPLTRKPNCTADYYTLSTDNFQILSQTKKDAYQTAKCECNILLEELNLQLSEYKIKTVKLEEEIDDLQVEKNELINKFSDRFLNIEYEKYKLLYNRKCEELMEFENSFNNICDKFYLLLDKNKAFQDKLVEENRRVNKFSELILEAYRDKNFETLESLLQAPDDRNNVFVNESTSKTTQKSNNSLIQVDFHDLHIKQLRTSSMVRKNVYILHNQAKQYPFEN